MLSAWHRSRAVASAWLVVRAALRSFGANRSLEAAATLAFYGFLSLMPLLLVAVIALGSILRSSDAASAALGSFVQDLFPGFNTALLSDLQAITAGGALSLVSVVLLVWSMTPLSGALRTALARMFAMPIQRPFVLSKAVDLAAVLSFLLFFLLLVLVRVFLPPDAAGWLRFLSGTAFPFLVCVGFIGLFFRVFAPVRLTWRQWVLGAVCVTLLWAVMRDVFVVFIRYNPNYGYAFGSLKAMFLVVVWVYYVFAALLFGAEIMANTYRRDALLLRDLLQPADARHGARSSLLKKFERDLADGAVLFREGDPGTEMFVVLEGGITLSRGDRELAAMKPGQYFGEMSLLPRPPRSATARAAGRTRLAAITQGNFDLLVRENPVLVRGLLEELARRLAETNRRVQADTPQPPPR